MEFSCICTGIFTPISQLDFSVSMVVSSVYPYLQLGLRGDRAKDVTKVLIAVRCYLAKSKSRQFASATYGCCFNKNSHR